MKNVAENSETRRNERKIPAVDNKFSFFRFSLTNDVKPNWNLEKSAATDGRRERDVIGSNIKRGARLEK